MVEILFGFVSFLRIFWDALLDFWNNCKILYNPQKRLESKKNIKEPLNSEKNSYKPWKKSNAQEEFLVNIVKFQLQACSSRGRNTRYGLIYVDLFIKI